MFLSFFLSLFLYVTYHLFVYCKSQIEVDIYRSHSPVRQMRVLYSSIFRTTVGPSFATNKMHRNPHENIDKTKLRGIPLLTIVKQYCSSHLVIDKYTIIVYCSSCSKESYLWNLYILKFMIIVFNSSYNPRYFVLISRQSVTRPTTRSRACYENKNLSVFLT